MSCSILILKERMKNKYILLVSSGSILAWSLYFSPTEPNHEPVKIVRDTTTDRTKQVVSPFWEATLFWSQESIPVISGDTTTLLHDFLDKNPILKQRIQGIPWYRDFISGTMPVEIANRYIQDAFTIEQVLIDNPGILQRIHYESWWQRYTRGDTNPTDMLSGNIASYWQLQKIEQENPLFYSMASKSPLWNSGIQQWQDYIVVWQKEILISLALRLKFLDENPDIEKNIQEQWFTRNNLFTDDWSKWEGIYKALDTLLDGQPG